MYCTYHLVPRLEALVGQLWDCERFMVGLVCRHQWRIGDKREVHSWERHQVSAPLLDACVDGALEAQRSCDGADHLRHKSVDVGIGGALHVQHSVANIVTRLS